MDIVIGIVDSPIGQNVSMRDDIVRILVRNLRKIDIVSLWRQEFLLIFWTELLLLVHKLLAICRHEQIACAEPFFHQIVVEIQPAFDSLDILQFDALGFVQESIDKIRHRQAGVFFDIA